jgi:hypothetical protein
MRFRLNTALLAVLGLGLLAGPLAATAHAERDRVQFGSTIDVPKGDTAHDTVCFFCSVNVQGTVTGDIVVFFGSVHVDGQANHDVVNFFGETRVADNSAISHDLVNFFGGVRLGENASVGQDMVIMFGDLHAPANATNGGSRVIEPPWLFWGPFLFIFAGIFLGVGEFRSYRRRRFLRGY